MAIDVTRRYTVADLYEMFPEGSTRERIELVDGVMYVTPTARVRHQWVVGRFTYRIARWTEEHGGEVYPGANYDIGDDTHLEPDVVYTTNEDTSGLALPQTPDLVVEVSSPSTRRHDVGVKKDRYARAGTPEFWFADLVDDQVLRSVLVGARYGDPEVYGRGDEFTTPLFPGLVFDVDDLLGAPERV